MITFLEYLKQQENLEEGWKTNLAAGLGLLAAGAGVGYGLKGTGNTSQQTSQPAAVQQVQEPSATMDHESLKQDFIQKNKDNPKYKSKFGNAFRNINRDAEMYAAGIIAKQAGAKPGQKTDFSIKHGKVSNVKVNDSEDKTIQKKSGSVDD